MSCDLTDPHLESGLRATAQQELCSTIGQGTLHCSAVDSHSQVRLAPL